MPFKFEELRIWHLAISFATEIHILTQEFPKEERYVLVAQFKRAADSISMNISEGSIGQSNAEQLRFLHYSIRSIAESVNCLYLSKEREYISNEDFRTLYKKAELLFAMTYKFINSLKGNK